MVHRGFHGQKSLKHARLSKICCCCCSVAKSCLTFCNPMDCSIPGSSVLCYLPELAKLKFISIESVMLSNYLICCRSFFFCLQSFPASGSFPVSWLFTSGGQSIRVSASASVLPMNVQGWSPLELTGLISMQSRGFWRVFSSTTVWKHQFFSTQPSLWSNSHIQTQLQEKP